MQSLPELILEEYLDLADAEDIDRGDFQRFQQFMALNYPQIPVESVWFNSPLPWMKSRETAARKVLRLFALPKPDLQDASELIGRIPINVKSFKIDRSLVLQFMSIFLKKASKTLPLRQLYVAIHGVILKSVLRTLDNIQVQNGARHNSPLIVRTSLNSLNDVAISIEIDSSDSQILAALGAEIKPNQQKLIAFVLYERVKNEITVSRTLPQR